MNTARFAHLFGTPVLEHLWPDSTALNTTLRDAIMMHAERDAGTAQTNIGGWHSSTGVLDFCGQAGAALIQRMLAMTEEATFRLYAAWDRPREPLHWTLSAWANVNHRGHYNTMHTHPGATWSGVYFVDSGHSDGRAAGTPLCLTDPGPTRTAAFFPDLLTSTVEFPPVPGLMVLFPSYLPHNVPPHRGDRPRISIAFNVRKDPYP